MADGGNKIGEVFIQVNAQGAEQAQAKIEAVAASAQKAAHATQTMIGGSSVAGPGFLSLGGGVGGNAGGLIGGAFGTIGGGTSVGGGANPLGGAGGIGAIASGGEAFKTVAREAAKAGTEVEATGFKVRGLARLTGVLGSAEGLGGLTTGLTRFTAGLGGMGLGVAGAVLALGGLLEAIKKNREEQLAANRALADLTETWERYLKVTKNPESHWEREEQGIRDALEKQIESIDAVGKKANLSAVEIGRREREAQKDALDAIAALRERQGNDYRIKEAQKETKAFEEIKNKRLQIEKQADLESLEGYERLEREKQYAVADLENQLRDARDEDTKSELQKSIDATEQLYNFKIDKAKIAATEAAQAEIDAAQKVELARQRAIDETIRRSQESLISAFGSNQTTQLLQEMVSNLKTVAEGVRRLN